ncbi:MAG: nucleoside deaminase [Acidobacteriota bacterium]
MRQALSLAREALATGSGGPFGAVVVRGDAVIGSGRNRVLETGDPTAHAEMEAIREACRRQGTFALDGALIYTSCEPCPMCLGAIYWARLDRIFYAASRDDAAAAGFDDRFIHEEMVRTDRRLPADQILREAALPALRRWAADAGRTRY